MLLNGSVPVVLGVFVLFSLVSNIYFKNFFPSMVHLNFSFCARKIIFGKLARLVGIDVFTFCFGFFLHFYAKFMFQLLSFALNFFGCSIFAKMFNLLCNNNHVNSLSFFVARYTAIGEQHGKNEVHGVEKGGILASIQMSST